MKYKEHYPNRIDILDRNGLYPGDKPLCGQKDGIVLNLWRSNDMSEEAICSKCRRKACPDCFGTGVMGGGEAGIYCSCLYGSLREFKS